MGLNTNNNNTDNNNINNINDFNTALNNRNSAVGSFSNVIHQIEQREKELKKREEALRSQQQTILEEAKKWAEVEKLTKHREEQSVIKEKELKEKEEKLNKLEERITEAIKRAPTKIQLNIGGKEFVTSKNTILSHPGSLLEDLILTSNDSSPIFVDRDPKLFPAVLNYMRDKKIRNSDIAGFSLDEVKNEFIFFNLPFPLLPEIDNSNVNNSNTNIDNSDTNNNNNNNNNTTTNAQTEFTMFEGGDILTPDFKQTIQIWLPNHRFVLLYKGLRDGFSGDDFHQNTDNNGPTITIIVSQNGFVFGGFSSFSWDSSNQYKSNSNSFIFTLTNPFSIPPTVYYLSPGDKCAIGCYKGESAIFGYRGGNDIWMRSQAHQHSKSVIHFPKSYVDTTGKGANTFTGNSSFSCLDVEVYSVVPLDN